MGTISREATAPIADGETASGDELELEFDKIFTEINGNLDNANIKAAAAIAGSKLANNSVTETQMTANTLTTASFAASAVPKAYVDLDDTADNFTTSTTFVDVPNITSWTVTPGSASDILWLDFTFSCTRSNAAVDTFAFGFSIDGVDTDDIVTVRNVPETGGSGGFLLAGIHVPYAVAAGGTSSIVIKPRYRQTDIPGTTISFTSYKVFRGMVIPIK